MGFKSTVMTRTPHADYTEKYNQHMDKLKKHDETKHIKKSQDKIENHYELKRQKANDSHQSDKKLQLRKELDSIHQYEVLSNRRSYYEYKYQFYVGTLFDSYI